MSSDICSRVYYWGKRLHNIILLLTIPTFIDAYLINQDYYITIASDRLLGFYVRNGASIPFIFFFPIFLAIILCIVLTIIRNKKIQVGYKVIIYILLSFLYALNIFLLINFKTLFSPLILLLIRETTSTESTNFLENYLFSPSSLLSYSIILLSLSIIFLSEHLHTLNRIAKNKI